MTEKLLVPFHNIITTMVLLAASALCACQQAAPRPAVNAAVRAPLVLAADTIFLEERYPGPGNVGGEEKNFATTPASAVRNWVNTRLHADGTPGTVKVILLDARLSRQDLTLQRGMQGAFSDDQKWRYDGRIYLRVEHIPAAGQAPTHAEAQATGFFTVPETATVNELEQKVATLVQELMQRTDLEMENAMLRHMPGVVR